MVVRTIQGENVLFNDHISLLFESAISKPYPPDSHLKEHGDMAEEALRQLYTLYQQDPDQIDIIFIEPLTEQGYTTYIFKSKIQIESPQVRVPLLEALTWHFKINKPQIESVISLLPSNFTPETRWAYALLGFVNSTGGIQPSTLPVILGSRTLFKSGNFRSKIPELPESFTDRIKRSNIELLHNYLDSFGLLIPPEIDISVLGYPKAILEVGNGVRPCDVMFKTAFIDEEKMPNIRREIELGLRTTF